MSLLEDPRSRNSVFPYDSVKEHVAGYIEALSSALRSLDWNELERAVAVINKARSEGASLWVAGNGGSAAIADHLICDWLKGTYAEDQPPINVHSLTSDIGLLTACINDFGYETAFSRQIAMRARQGDVLICISSSGNSPNVIAAIRQAKAKVMTTIALTGFTGGETAVLADVNLHVEAFNYGVVEDSHQVVMHNIAQFIYGRSGRGR